MIVAIFERHLIHHKPLSHAASLQLVPSRARERLKAPLILQY